MERIDGRSAAIDETPRSGEADSPPRERGSEGGRRVTVRRKVDRKPDGPDQVLGTAEVAEPTPLGPSRTRTALLVVLMLVAHYTAAFDSLRRENPTVDEVAHMPAGISYWQRGTFKLYHHNPPLSKLVAALPVVLLRPVTEPLYSLGSWMNAPPSQASFGQSFAFLNADRYFELFTLARAVMPLFSVVGGLFVFAWSSRLYGRLGGLLSLALWCLCPNILAHARLVTSDVAGAAMAVGATYVFWRHLRNPTWKWAVLAGLMLGLAELTKFSLLLLYAYWPLLWLAKILIERDFSGWPRRLGRDAVQGLAIVALSVVVIDVGYGFEGVGKPLGSYEFICKTLTRPRGPVVTVPPDQLGPNWLAQLARQNRVNRFRDTPLGRVPAPLPYHFLMGFDDQRIETEGIPLIWADTDAKPGETGGYPVYLDGTLRYRGWWYYYLACLAYKVPEGTWLVVIAATVALFATRRPRSAWFDEFAVLAYPAIVLFTMTALTDINLGLRYVLSIFPFAFVAAGKVVPWAGSLRGRWRKVVIGGLAASLGMTAAQTILIHPHYLASFNWASGGPDRGSEHLIDSNLDWGQDLVTLRRWVAEHRSGQRVGLAYFGQINPNIFLLRKDDFRWFLPPVMPGSTRPMYQSPALIGPEPTLKPGLYAVSATLMRGLPWRVYDPGDPSRAWSAAWDVRKLGGFGYFAELTPIAKVGHSIFVYELTQAECDRINPRLTASPPGPGRAGESP